jgi:tRNA threonylcarbamoyl adenosine modification protein YeaZ
VTQSLRILAFDTSTPQGGVAVLEGERLLSSKIWSRGKSHSELLTPTIENCLSQANLSLNQIDCIAVGHGPGSFTGIRIAINVARSLAFALGKRVVAFDTTEIIAAGCKRHDLPVLVLLNAQMNLLFASTFVWDNSARRWQRRLPLQALSIEQLEKEISEPHLCLGEGFLDYEFLFTDALRAKLVRDTQYADDPPPEALGLLAVSSTETSTTLDWIHLQPLYIRASGAEEKLREDMGRQR